MVGDKFRLKPGDWLVAEATRRREEASETFPLDNEATRQAARLPDPVPRRIVARARGLPGATDLVGEVRRMNSMLKRAAAAWLLLGAIAGIAAAANLRMGGTTIALSYALLALLGIPLLMLLMWALGGLVGRGSGNPGLPGRITWMVARRFGAGAERRYLAAAAADLGRIGGRRLMAAVTHGFWTAFFIGAIGWTSLLFLGLRFDFSWETTLLTGPWVGEMILWIGTPPAWLFGLELPDAKQLQAALVDRSAAADRRLWAGYLIGALAFYGLIPRAVLAAFSMWRWQRLRPGLDLGRTGYLRLLPALAGTSAAAAPEGPVPEGDGPDSRSAAGRRDRKARPGSGLPVAIGFELDDPEPAWPPTDASLRVLGRADNRTQRRQIEEAIRILDPKPAAIVVFVSPARTPDRGTGRWLAELERIAPVRLRWIDRGAARSGDGAPRHRSDDWLAMCQRFDLAPPERPKRDADSSDSVAED